MFFLFDVGVFAFRKEKRPTKAKLVSYSKQVLPKYIDEQPTEDNSPLLVLSPKGGSAAEAKLMVSPRSSSTDVKEPKSRFGIVTAPPGTPISSRRSIFNLGGRSSGSVSQDLPASRNPASPPSSLAASARSLFPSLMGASLEELAQFGRSSVPVLLVECFAWIRSSGALDHNGLFRGAGGDTDRIERIVTTFEQQPREPHRVLERIEPSEDDVCALIKL